MNLGSNYLAIENCSVHPKLYTILIVCKSLRVKI